MHTSALRILILAGPNGAGKTTFAREFLPKEAGFPEFINADLIAAGLSPFQPDAVALRAGRLMVEIVREHVTDRMNFAFETTLADRGLARSILEWQAAGYHVSLMFLALRSPEIALQRVKERAQHGGHSVPEAVIRRRFLAGRANFDRVFRQVVDAWALYDNSNSEPVLLDWGEKS